MFTFVRFPKIIPTTVNWSKYFKSIYEIHIMKFEWTPRPGIHWKDSCRHSETKLSWAILPTSTAFSENLIMKWVNILIPPSYLSLSDGLSEVCGSYAGHTGWVLGLALDPNPPSLPTLCWLPCHRKDGDVLWGHAVHHRKGWFERYLEGGPAEQQQEQGVPLPASPFLFSPVVTKTVRSACPYLQVVEYPPFAQIDCGHFSGKTLSSTAMTQNPFNGWLIRIRHILQDLVFSIE